MKNSGYSATLEKVFKQTSKLKNKGDVAGYIPELAAVDPRYFGVYLNTLNEGQYGLGDYNQRFSIQSIAKVLSLCLAYWIRGEKLWDRIGVEPSGTAFNSLVQLEADKGIPRNPFINAGALVVCDVLITHLENAKEDFLTYVRDISDNLTLNYAIDVANSEREAGFRNIALCNFIKSFKNIDNDPNEVLDFYFHMCSLEMNCAELSNAFLFLANEGRKLPTNGKVLSKSKTKRINALMQTCGFYDESGEFSFKVGLPGKSGVGGGIIAIYPKQYSIAVWSPKLNKKWNSYRGMRFLEAFTSKTEKSIF